MYWDRKENEVCRLEANREFQYDQMFKTQLNREKQYILFYLFRKHEINLFLFVSFICNNKAISKKKNRKRAILYTKPIQKYTHK